MLSKENMERLDKLTASMVLRIDKCGDLYTKSIETAKEEYWYLAKKFHPDTSLSAKDDNAIAHINKLYTDALRMILDGKWETSNKLHIQSKTSKMVVLNYIKTFPFELGDVYIGRTYIAYLLNPDKGKFYDQAIRSIRNFRYASDKMREKMEHSIPIIRDSFECNDGRYFISMAKTEDTFLLRDVLDHYNGQIPEKHVSWIISRFMNIVSFVNYCGLSHNGITIDSCLIDPAYHGIMLTGGWWYSVELGSKLIGTTKCVYDIIPPKAKTDKVGNTQIDMECVRAVAKQLLGGVTPSKPINDWIIRGSSADIRNEYKTWDDALFYGYGERKFITMDVKSTDIYK